MPKQKYDYNKIKMEFMQSDFDEVKGFLSDKGVRYNSRWTTRTKGWAKEKQQMKDKILAKATQNAITKQAKELEIPMEQLTIAKKNAVVKVIQKMMNTDLDMSDLERSIKILRTEMGLPTTYSKNENMNLEKIEGIHIVMGGNNISQGEKDVDEKV